MKKIVNRNIADFQIDDQSINDKSYQNNRKMTICQADQVLHKSIKFEQDISHDHVFKSMKT